MNRKESDQNMATSTIVKQTYVAKLNNGVGPTGAVKTLNLSLGTIKSNIADTSATWTKALAIAAALEACLIKSIYYVDHGINNRIES